MESRLSWKRGWSLREVQSDPHDRVKIDAEPPIDLTIKNGIHGDIATSAITLNAIPSLIAAKPGLHTMATVPMVHFVPRA